jgi:hypothetical protein
MDDDLKEKIVDYFTPVELVDWFMEDDDELMHDLVEFLRDRIEDNITSLKEYLAYGD